jgi:TMEM70/TMEM186/TMEM223 protein family
MRTSHGGGRSTWENPSTKPHCQPLASSSVSSSSRVDAQLFDCNLHRSPGYLVLFVGWTYTLRSVRYLVALKNGKDVSLVTYTPFGKNRMMDVPIRCISAEETRHSARVYLPLKVKNRTFFYILDMKGEFTNTKLFDQSIALKRRL